MELYRYMLIGASCLAFVVFGDYATDETALLTTLRTGYSVDARPDNYTLVTTTILMFAIDSVDIGKELMSISGILISFWYDGRLRWDPGTTGISKMVVQTKYVWTPPIIIENEINSKGLLSQNGVPLRLVPYGLVFWAIPLSTTTLCSVNIMYYPYDTQTCTITVVVWSYTTDEVDQLTNPSSPIDVSHLSKNGEWELRSTGYSYMNLTDGGSTYRKVNFLFTFRRKWQFYGQNIILPIVLNSILMGMVFAVPIESGEKMGYCLTVLLSYIVLLTLVSDKLPSLSDEESVIQIYLSVSMSLGTLGTLCTIVVLKLYHQHPEKSVPAWLLTFVTCCLAPLTCQCCNCCSSRRVTPGKMSKFVENENNMDNAAHPQTYQSIAKMLDKLFFWVFSLMISAMTCVFVITMNVQYNAS